MGEPVKPLVAQSDALLILDQTLLPNEERWLRCSEPEQVADAIRRLAVRGAPAIGLAAAYGLALAGADPARVRAAAELLAGARPTAVDLRWAVERSLRAYEAALAKRGEEAGLEALRAAADELARERLEQDRRLAAHGVELLPAAARVLTHCNTGALATGGGGSAGGVIEAAWRAGRLEHVWVDETRPLLQGARLTAWELGRAGIPHTLVVDASAGALMARGLVDAVIVGADRVAANGDVANKVGTYSLAVLAAHHGLPLYVAAPTSTVDAATPNGAAIPIEERGGDEVRSVRGAAVAPSGVATLNLAFDVTPHDLVAAIVTEAGVLREPLAEAIATLADGGVAAQLSPTPGC